MPLQRVRDAFKDKRDHVVMYTTEPVIRDGENVLLAGLKTSPEEAEEKGITIAQRKKELNLPDKIAGYRVLYHFEGEIKKARNTHHDPLIGGIEVAHNGAATLGGFVFDKDTHETYALISEHLSPECESSDEICFVGEPVYQPDGGSSFGTVQAAGIHTQNCDAATVSIDTRGYDTTAFYGLVDEVPNKPKMTQEELTPGDLVAKDGRTTGYTESSIISVYTDVTISSWRGNETFTDVIMVDNRPEFSFTDFGDSGSMVWHMGEMRPIGIFMGLSAYESYIIPAVTVEDVLNVTYADPSISFKEATFHGEITDAGGDFVIEAGVVYSTSSHVDPGDTRPLESDYENWVSEFSYWLEDSFSVQSVSLKPDTTYYVRAYARNASGVSYGAETSFTTGEEIIEHVQVNLPHVNVTTDEHLPQVIATDVDSVTVYPPKESTSVNAYVPTIETEEVDSATINVPLVSCSSDAYAVAVNTEEIIPDAFISVPKKSIYTQANAFIQLVRLGSIATDVLRDPRLLEYDFYLAQRDSSGNYSSYTHMEVYHPGIELLPEQVEHDIQNLVLQIRLPKARTTRDIYTNEVLGVGDRQIREVLGYVVRLEYDPTNSQLSETLNDKERWIASTDIDRRADAEGHYHVAFEIPQFSAWKVYIGAYDSAVHPQYNRSTFEGTFTHVLDIEPPAIPSPELSEITHTREKLSDVSGFGHYLVEGSLIAYWDHHIEPHFSQYSVEVDSSTTFESSDRKQFFTDSSSIRLEGMTTQDVLHLRVQALATSEPLMILTWGSDPNVEYFVLQYRKEGEDNWSEQETSSNTANVVGSPDTVYEFRVKAIDHDQRQSAWSDIITIDTATLDVQEFHSDKATYLHLDVSDLLHRSVSKHGEAWENMNELMDADFFADLDNFSGENIRPNTIQTQALAVGSPLRNFQLVNIDFRSVEGVFEWNNADVGEIGFLLLIEDPDETYEIETMWDIPGGSFNPLDNTKYWIYARCHRHDSSNAAIYTQEMNGDRPSYIDGNYFQFIIGVLNTEKDPMVFSSSYGFTFIDGGHITTGTLNADQVNIISAGADVTINEQGIIVKNGKISIDGGVLTSSDETSTIDLSNNLMNLGDKFSWDGSSLSIEGSVIITGGSGISELTDAGLMAQYDDISEDTTFIEGGYIKTGFIHASRIDTGQLSASRIDTDDLFAQTLTIQPTGSINVGEGLGKLTIDANGISTESGTFSFLTETGDAYFGGKLQAASGTFTGELQAASGTFAGSLSAASGTFTGTLEASGEVLLDTIGDGASASGTGSMALGNNSDASGDNSISVGRFSEATLESSVAVGRDASASGGVAVGTFSNTNAQDTVAIGTAAEANANRGIAIGRTARALGERSVAIGWSATASGYYSGCLLNPLAADENYLILIGTDSHTTSIPGDLTIGGNLEGAGGFGTVDADLYVNYDEYEFTFTGETEVTVNWSGVVFKIEVELSGGSYVTIDIDDTQVFYSSDYISSEVFNPSANDNMRIWSSETITVSNDHGRDVEKIVIHGCEQI